MSSIWQIKNKHKSALGDDIRQLLDSARVTDWLGNKSAPVILKPNLVVAKPAATGATTTPAIVAGLIEYLRDHGYSRIIIAEGSWVGDSTAKAFKKCGYTELASKYNIDLIDLQKEQAVAVPSADGTYKICKTIADLKINGGSLINLPVLKGHGQTLLTCALKNLKGCIPDSEKRRYHSLGVHDPVAVLNTIIKPAFSLVDGLNGDPGWEEGGSPFKRDMILLGRDPVSLDAYGCSLLGLDITDVPYILKAQELGVGDATEKNIDVITLGKNRHKKNRNENLAASTAKSRRNDEDRIWIDTVVDQKSACSACFGNLAGALRDLEQGRRNLLKEKSICIGQDFVGSVLPDSKLGIGRCTSGPRILNGCPPGKEAIKDFLLNEQR